MMYFFFLSKNILPTVYLEVKIEAKQLQSGA